MATKEYLINRETQTIEKLRDRMNSLSANTAGQTTLFEFHILNESYGLDAYIKKWQKIDDDKWRVVHNYCLEAKTRNYKADVFDRVFLTTMLQSDKRDKMMEGENTPLYATFTSDGYVYVHNLNQINFNKIKAKKETHNWHSGTNMNHYGERVEKLIYQLPVIQGLKMKL